MKLQNIIKPTLLLVFALSFTNCKDEACKTELKAVKQELTDLKNALDTPITKLEATAKAFDFCESNEAISSGNYNTTIGIANVVIPIPVDSELKSMIKKGNTVNYVFEGTIYSNDTKDYEATITNLSRTEGEVLIIEVKFLYDENECNTKSIQSERFKKSKVSGGPLLKN